MKTNHNNFTNINELQIVKKHTTLSLLSLLMALYMIFNPIFSSKSDNAHHNSINKAKAVAYQVAAITNKKISLNQDTLGAGRSPASFDEVFSQTGAISQNEYGQPYHYEISRLSGKIKITIWSKQDFTDKTEVLIPSEKL